MNFAKIRHRMIAILAPIMASAQSLPLSAIALDGAWANERGIFLDTAGCRLGTSARPSAVY